MKCPNCKANNADNAVFCHACGTKLELISDKSIEDYLREWRKAADNNEVWAQRNLGLAYLKGTGVQEDVAEAARWLHKAAQQGDSDSQFLFGHICFDTKEFSLAEHFFMEAAKQGHSDAQYKLATMYENGSGVPKDIHAAVLLYNKAAAQGNIEAINALNRLKFKINQMKTVEIKQEKPSENTSKKGCLSIIIAIMGLFGSLLVIV